MRLMLMLLFSACLAIVPAAAQKSAKGRGEAKQPLTTVAGILDQNGDDFVIRSADSMGTAAVLRAEGFSADNFARFVGNRVEARGEISTEGERKILTIRSLDHLKKTGPAGTEK